MGTDDKLIHKGKLKLKILDAGKGQGDSKADQCWSTCIVFYYALHPH